MGLLTPDILVNHVADVTPEMLAGLAPGLAADPEALSLATLYARLSWPLAIGAVLAAVASAAPRADVAPPAKASTRRCRSTTGTPS